jgi:hypothetical protein
MVSSSLFDQGDHLQAFLINKNPFSIPFRGTTSSSISVCMNTLNSNNRKRNRVKTLVTFHKQAKFLSNYTLLHIVPFCEGPNEKPEGFVKQKQKT